MVYKMDKEFIIEYLKKRNYWWGTSKIDEDDKGIERDYISDIEELLKLDRIVCLSGIRRAGKSTLMFQSMDSLIKKGIKPDHVVYAKMDDLSGKIDTLHDVVNVYHEISGVNPKNEIVYFFFDEVHFMKNWQQHLKFYIDLKSGSKFIVSGSSKTLLYKDASESLAGRIRFMDIFPLTFREFVKFSGNEINIERFFYTKNIAEIKEIYYDLLPKKEGLIYLFREYLTVGGFPEWFKVKNIRQWRRILVDDYLSLILFKDIIHTFKIKDPILLENLVRETARFSTQRFSYLSLSNRLDADRETIKLYLYYLKASMLIFISGVYSKNKKIRERSEKKIYFWEEGMRKALTLDENEATAVENVAAWHLIKEGFTKKVFFEPFYWKNTHETDFVLDTDILLPVEIKYREHPKDVKGLLNFMEKFSVKKGIVVTKDLLEEREFNINGLEVKVLYIPAWLFLLSQ